MYVCMCVYACVCVCVCVCTIYMLYIRACVAPDIFVFFSSFFHCFLSGKWSSCHERRTNRGPATNRASFAPFHFLFVSFHARMCLWCAYGVPMMCTFAPVSFFPEKRVSGRGVCLSCTFAPVYLFFIFYFSEKRSSWHGLCLSCALLRLLWRVWAPWSTPR